jgi:hypothetical protein
VAVSTAVATKPRAPEPSAIGAGSSNWPHESTTARSHRRAIQTSEVDRICQRVNQLDSLERARLLRALSAPPPDGSLARSRVLGSRHQIACFLALCCLALIPWTISLAVTLPRTYLVATWPLAWTGFDVVLLGCLGTTAWALWKQRQVAVAASMITSVLLLCDAWFDIVTAHSGRCLALSIITAVVAEIPIAILLGLISVRLMQASGRAARGFGMQSGSLWRTPLGVPIGSAVRPGRTTATAGPASGEVEEAGQTQLEPHRFEQGSAQRLPTHDAQNESQKTVEARKVKR